MSSELTNIAKAVTEIGERLDSNYLTKESYKIEAKKFADTVDALSKQMDRKRVEEHKDPVFGTKAACYDFINCIKGAMEKSSDFRHLSEQMKQPTERNGGIDKSWIHKDLDTYTTNAGAELIPTSVSPVLSFLLSQYGVARREATFIGGVQGNLTLTVRDGTSSAAYTNGSGTTKDDVAVTPSVMGTDKVSLSPQQISTLSLVSDKLLFASAVNIAEIVAIDLVEQTGVLEDNTAIRGDGTYAFGNNTGITANTSVPKLTTSASSGFLDLDDVIKLPAQVHESVYSSPNAKYYISGAIIQTLKTKKASTAGIYFLNPEVGAPQMMLSGYPLVVWHRLDNTVATGKNIVLFGDMKKCLTVGTGRDMQLLVSRDYKFNTNQVAFRLSEDFGVAVVQPKAMAYLQFTS